MQKETLADYALKHGQLKTAQVLGVRQSAISKALRVGRKIYVKTLDDGSVEAEEIRPFPALAINNKAA
ncbi:Cro/Cl family transcriptional regulator [Salmonella enterica]|uniref:Cro/Cl family transcriptional regulator n=2 Tax=Salmonella enterica TaxID=28901 RepID=A0A633DI26_SALER|nr:Cro/Cl family transcriptional regulator [Salmonella enterica]EBQ4756792.1 Cro/Cl family transcriptional regulator [Salmonella enterica subsp. diarizonae]EBW2601689.1 Cro/Cl family transcriptional regulator [Salmonella enterica subsp. enterica serovar Poano]EBZ5136751.1 Cro/Cl family transcriptional regulator [Salmonella enterica subsp. enterica serovar Antsalova]ECD6161615.1 Cro/Cl family transcriptional regulator [Salmonella enterica subsp. enterica]ECU7994271.1 Cro/Cl family transcription